MKRATQLLWILLLCGGCAAPFARLRGAASCGTPVAGEDQACAGDESCSCGHCALPLGCGGYGCACCACSSAIGVAETIVCWPVHTVCYAINFCAPDGYIGPSPAPGPGRFHPVPTHPVFEPAAPPLVPGAPL